MIAEDNDKKQLFFTCVKSMRPQQLADLLRCSICSGLFRLAHTIIDCGHTFCQFCIFSYIKSFKGRNPSVKCPQCNSQIGSNYSKSIMKDAFKQNLIDILQPSFMQKEQNIISRVKQLFPLQNLQFLIDEYKFSEINQNKIKKNEQKNFIMTELINQIKIKLNLSFENFIEQLSNHEKFLEFQTIIKNKQKKDKLLEIKPKTSREEKFVGINHKMKAEGLTINKLVRFIEKKALQNIKNFPENVLKEFLNQQKTRIDMKIRLDCLNFNLSPDSDLSECNQPIYYILY